MIQRAGTLPDCHCCVPTGAFWVGGNHSGLSLDSQIINPQTRNEHGILPPGECYEGNGMGTESSCGEGVCVCWLGQGRPLRREGVACKGREGGSVQTCGEVVEAEDRKSKAPRRVGAWSVMFTAASHGSWHIIGAQEIFIERVDELLCDM